MADSIKPGAVLNERYRIWRQLEQRGFESIYLAEDTQRSQSHCLLREVAPEIAGNEAIQKVETLLIAEAEALSQVQHPQIPRFYELFRLQRDGKRTWFFVNDYPEGPSYRQLRQTRASEGKKFTEAEVVQLLSQLLSVLDYIHSLGIIHRDISPDTIILRQEDGLPVLTNFGGIKQVAAAVESECLQSGAVQVTGAIVTRLWQVGYAPDEQIQRGLVFPNSDLYALAVTAVVLLAGKEPTELIDPRTRSWHWSEQIALSPNLANILEKMLASQPGDRWQSAREVLQALDANTARESQSTTERELQPTVAAKGALAADAEAIQPTTTAPVMTTSSPSASNPLFGCMSKLIVVLLLIAGSGVVGWLAGKSWLEQATRPQSEKDFLQGLPSSVFGNQDDILSEGKWQGNEDLRRRRRQLGLNQEFYLEIVNQLFWSKYPSQEGRIPTSVPEDSQWRERWDTVAKEFFDQIASFSPQAVHGMGRYDELQRDRWKQAVNQLHLSSRALYDLADARFFSLFPEQKNQEFSDRPIGQVWSALVFDQLKALQSGEIYQELTLTSETGTQQSRGTLQPGGGQAFVVQLNASESLQVELVAEGEVLFSLYSPTGKNNILEDSPQRQWSGILPESGFYEFVLVSKAKQPLNYQLNLTLGEGTGNSEQ